MVECVLKNQNLHISQTGRTNGRNNKGFEESKFTYLSNLYLDDEERTTVLKNQNLHISQTSNLRFRVEILNLGIKKWTDTDPAKRQFR